MRPTAAFFWRKLNHLGFTPATNLIALRRLSLKIGQRAEAPAAYLSFPKMRLVKLSQIYRRASRTEYEYEAPTVGYAGTLQVATSGAIVHYPGLFELLTSVWARREDVFKIAQKTA
jgi:hypothetical protein